MQCPRNFLISATPYSMMNFPDFQTKYSSFYPLNRTKKIYHDPKANHGIYGENESEKMPLFPPKVKSITSTSNPFVKHCVKLRLSSSYRQLHGSVPVVGAILVREIFGFYKSFQDRPIIECLLVLDNNSHVPEEIDDPSVHIIRVNSVVMNKLAGVQSADSVDVIALVRIPTTFHVAGDNLHEEDCRKWFSFPHRILVLDGIQDPGNLGTLLRSATAFRWGGVLLLPGCCDPFNEKALRAGRGACFQVQIVSGNWTHIETLRKEFQMKMLAGHPSISDKLNPVLKLSKEFADSLAELPLCLVLGSEGTGLSETSKSSCELVSIPMAGEFESLNVSVAGGIFMYMLQPENHAVL
ncbi:hypothetical protein F511_19654 [Dorcoceras hygrometricum]|uniref:tRNA/rRNA methyltransferase SpoU type domain-containing protein n=1 Tax=Dorcoceras hygrometricum TaxID=472368 RepID=A0A2Z7B7M3_9LAMI|nr:hypothetical protein F511_19654 [Dorcoceras hygrometricum]